MPIQTSYGFSHDALLPGMAADLTNKDDITCYHDDTNGLIPGIGVVYDGEADGSRWKVARPSATGQVFVGVVKHSHTEPLSGDVDTLGTVTTTQTAKYAVGAAVPVRKSGRVAVYVEGAVAVDDQVYMRHTANSPVGAGEGIGYFRADAGGGDADIITNARFVTETTGAGVAWLEITPPYNPAPPSPSP